MKENEVTIVIPTHNHPQYIDNILKSYRNQGLCCKIVILDSSQLNDTKIVYENYKNKISDLEYIYVCDLSPDEKSLYALKICRTKYLWICGDGLIIKRKIFNSTILNNDCDIIHLIDISAHDNKNYCTKNKIPQNMVLENAYFFAEHFFWTGTFMGSILISNTIRCKLLKEKLLDKYINTGFMLICGVLEILTKEKIKIQVILTKYYTPNSSKKEAIWMQSEDIFKIWAQNMPRAVEKLPYYYNKIKNDIIKYTAVRNNYLSRRGLIRWRAKGILNIKIEQKYEKDLLKTTTLSAFEIRIISQIPIIICKFFIIPFTVRNKLKRLIFSDNFKVMRGEKC